MIDRAEIIRSYERIEAERGGWHKVNAVEVCRAVAEELGLTMEQVRSAMLDEWTFRMSG